ncbi:MFS transporter [Geothrix oryzae]|uniref:MFS transporter n=1 Tax=Geothrix oryzae TaxID=2927975 RepID=A0ABM8DSW6_9BACT|nr:MFS transporter [Geothrix oryzae]BDU70113.1 MFS transporter [Geothrix oryzae]
MPKDPATRLQWLVFALVSAVFTTVYIPQPVLPVLRQTFGVGEGAASMTVSAVVLGIAVANLPFGALADRLPIRPILLTGGLVVSAAGVASALAPTLPLLVAARFLQGLFVPALTTCLAAYLAREMPAERLNVVMGSYVSATVVGGLSGRLLGGFVLPPAHWRWAFLVAAGLLLVATLAAHAGLPRERHDEIRGAETVRFRDVLFRHDLFRLYCVSAGAFFVFSSVFNYMPFYLHGAPFHWSTRAVTLLYLSYLVGVVAGPLAGRLSNRVGNGTAMVVGALTFGAGLAVTLVPRGWAMAVALALICAGFFTLHASAAGALNRKLSAGRGRANAFYVLFYYLGGAAGITLSGHAYHLAGWHGVVALAAGVLLVPLSTGVVEMRLAQRDGSATRSSAARAR